MSERRNPNPSGAARQEAPPAPGAAAPRRVGNPWMVVVSLSIAAATASIQQTAVLPLLPRLQESLHASVTSVTWAFTVSLLCGAVATPLFSRFGDMYGRRRMLLLTLALLVAGSVLGAVSTSVATLIVARVLQGVSAAMVPLAIGTVRELLPPEKMASGIGVLSATMGVGVGAGFLLSGVIAEFTDGYRVVFWIIAGLSLAATALTALVVRNAAPPAGGRPDLPGAFLLAGTLVCLLLAISQGKAWGWDSGAVICLFIGAAVLGAAWIAVERRTADPLVDIGMLTHRGTIGASLASMLLGFALFSGFTLLPNFAQTPANAGYGFGASVLGAGIYLLPTTILMLLVSTLAGGLIRRFSAANMVAIGAILAALSNVYLVLRHDHSYDLYVATTLLGLGVGCSFAALGTMAVEHVDASKTAVASAVNSLVRLVGGSIAGAVTSAILASDTIEGTKVPTLHAYEVSFMIAAVCVVLAAAFAALFGQLNQRAAASAALPR
ncbi:MFS transporter [Streptomyces leeuwenhoekii]|uniref:MFS transporter n=1 Tax=Streptomyces leeuwenhoekii TaxID=1437453 RepID=UPI00368EDDF5